MKLLSNKILLILLVIASFYGYVASCTHKEEVLPSQSTGTVTITRGTDILLPGTETAGDTTQWKLDQVHSSVLWSSNYLGAAGLLTGRFNMFGINDVFGNNATGDYVTSGQPVKDTSWAFYENDPTKTYFSGYVQMNTSNTGEPGRDGGCYLSYASAPKLITGTQNLTDSNLAEIKTTSVAFDPASSGYIVTAVLTWQGGLSAPHDTTINGTLSYIPKAVVGAGTASSYEVFGLQLNFQFDCRSFGVSTTEVGSIIQVQCNMNFNNK
jgi:polyisoprenoid-binding protein YceI